MKSIRSLLFGALLFPALGLLAAEAPKYGLAAENKIYAQQLVRELMAAHPDLYGFSAGINFPFMVPG